MMFLAGFIGLLQVVLLPGLLLAIVLRVPNPSCAILTCLPASLFVNYVLFQGVVFLKLPIHSTWLAIVALEISAILFLTACKRKKTAAEIFSKDFLRIKKWFEFQASQGTGTKISALIILIVGVLGIASLVFPILNTFGSAYKMWDDTLNWGRWAANWATTGTPGGDIWWYPQLGPINRAIPYVFMQTVDIHFFSKAFMPLFSIITCLMFLDLELRYKNLVFLTGSLLLSALVLKYGFQYHTSGLMDLPSMMLVFAAAYPLLKLDSNSNAQACRKALIFSAISGAAAILTKQSGLVVLAATPIVWLWVRKKVPELKSPKNLLFLLFSMGAAAASFYLPQYLRILSGADASNVGYLKTLTIRDPWLQTALLGTIFHYPLISGIVIISAILCLLYGSFRSLWLPMAVLFFLSWGSSLNYGLRNFYFGFPAIALMAADGACGASKKHFHLIIGLWKRMQSAVSFILKMPLVILASLLIGVFFGVFALIPDRVLINRQRNANLQMHPGYPINVIIDYFSLIDPNRKILTVFAPATTTPEGRGKLIYYDKNFSDNLEGSFKTLAEEQYGFFVYEPGMVSGVFAAKIQKGIETGEIKIVSRNQNTFLLHYNPSFFSERAAQD
jgi:hypothetical protein